MSKKAHHLVIISYTTVYEPWEEGDNEPEHETTENEPIDVDAVACRSGHDETECFGELAFQCNEYEEAGGPTSLAEATADAILKAEGFVEASSGSFHKGIWYTSETQIINYRTGQVAETNYHLKNYTLDEEQAVFKEMKSRGFALKQNPAESGLPLKTMLKAAGVGGLLGAATAFLKRK